MISRRKERKRIPMKRGPHGGRVRKLRKQKNIWEVQSKSKLMQKSISFPVFLNCQVMYQLMFTCVSKNVILVLKSKRKVRLNFSMPYDEMWRIYSEAKEHFSLTTAKKMHEVANYCIID